MASALAWRKRWGRFANTCETISSAKNKKTNKDSNPISGAVAISFDSNHIGSRNIGCKFLKKCQMDPIRRNSWGKRINEQRMWKYLWISEYTSKFFAMKITERSSKQLCRDVRPNVVQLPLMEAIKLPTISHWKTMNE